MASNNNQIPPESQKRTVNPLKTDYALTSHISIEAQDGSSHDFTLEKGATIAELNRGLLISKIVQQLKQFGIARQIASQIGLADDLRRQQDRFVHLVTQDTIANLTTAFLRLAESTPDGLERLNRYKKKSSSGNLTLDETRIYHWIYPQVLKVITKEAEKIAEEICAGVIFQIVDEKYLIEDSQITFNDLPKLIEEDLKNEKVYHARFNQSLNYYIRVLALEHCEFMRQDLKTLDDYELQFGLASEEITAAGLLPIAISHGSRRALKGEKPEYSLTEGSITISVEPGTSKDVISEVVEELKKLSNERAEICSKIINIISDRAVRKPRPFIDSVEILAVDLLELTGLSSTKKDKRKLVEAAELCSHIYLTFHPDTHQVSQKKTYKPVRLVGFRPESDLNRGRESFFFTFDEWIRYCTDSDLNRAC